jgi:hypothetical protein
LKTENTKNELLDYKNGNVSSPDGFIGNITQKTIGADETQRWLLFRTEKMFLNKDKNT